MAHPKIVYHRPKATTYHAYVVCPTCHEPAWIDEEQYHGEVSIDCRGCDYHETIDLSQNGDE